jgi:hypothetical protein
MVWVMVWRLESSRVRVARRMVVWWARLGGVFGWRSRISRVLGAAAMKGPGMPTPSLPMGRRTRVWGVSRAAAWRAARCWGWAVAGARARPRMARDSTAMRVVCSGLGAEAAIRRAR